MKTAGQALVRPNGFEPCKPSDTSLLKQPFVGRTDEESVGNKPQLAKDPYRFVLTLIFMLVRRLRRHRLAVGLHLPNRTYC